MPANTKGPFHQAGGVTFCTFFVPLTEFNHLGNSTKSPIILPPFVYWAVPFTSKTVQDERALVLLMKLDWFYS